MTGRRVVYLRDDGRLAFLTADYWTDVSLVSVNRVHTGHVREKQGETVDMLLERNKSLRNRWSSGFGIQQG